MVLAVLFIASLSVIVSFEANQPGFSGYDWKIIHIQDSVGVLGVEWSEWQKVINCRLWVDRPLGSLKPELWYLASFKAAWTQTSCLWMDWDRFHAYVEPVSWYLILQFPIEVYSYLMSLGVGLPNDQPTATSWILVSFKVGEVRGPRFSWGGWFSFHVSAVWGLIIPHRAT